MANNNQPLQLGKGDLALGQKLDLSKASTSGILKRIKIGLAWDENHLTGGKPFDADVSLLLKESMDPNEVCSSKNFFFYNQLVSEDGEQRYNSAQQKFEVVRPGYITHWGDNLTGDAVGDDESIDIDLDKIPANYVMAIVPVTIFQGNENEPPRNQTFSMMSNAYIRILNADTGEQLGKLDLDFDASRETGVIFGALVRRDSGWFFVAPQQIEGFQGGLQGFINKFHIQ